MALIKCKECGREISDQAKSCPHCGHQTASNEYTTKANQLLSMDIVGIAMQVIGAILFIPALISLMENGDSYYYKYSGDMDADLAFVAFGLIVALGGVFLGSYTTYKGRKNKEQEEARKREEARKLEEARKKDDITQM